MTLDIQFSAWAAITPCYFHLFSKRLSYTHKPSVGGSLGNEEIKVAGTSK